MLPDGSFSMTEPGPLDCLCPEECILAQSVFRCMCVCFFLPLSLSLGTGECGMAQPVVIKHVSCCLLQRYCSSLFIKGGCFWMLRFNFLIFVACLCSGLVVEWVLGGSMGHRVKGYWAAGDWPCLEVSWSSDPLFSLAPILS